MLKGNQLLIFIMTVGVFGIINTEMGVIGLLPYFSEQYNVSISEAGLLVSLFALVVAIAGPTMPLLFSGLNRKKAMLLVLGIFTIGNIASVIAPNFELVLLARIIPAFFHPVYCSMAFSVAAASVAPELSPKAVARVMIGVSAGMVIGVPISNFIAANLSLDMALYFFAAVNALTFLATMLFVPNMPVKNRLSYGAQLSVLRKFNVWLSIIAVVLLNGAIFGVFSYVAEYFTQVTGFDGSMVSTMLLVYGLANVLGSIIAGRVLVNNAILAVKWFPFLLASIYFVMFFAGTQTIFMVGLTVLWGTLSGIGGNINQYWISTAAPEAPDFANGLFLTSANLGTTVGALLCGYFIMHMGLPWIAGGGLLLALVSGIALFLRIWLSADKKQQVYVDKLVRNSSKKYCAARENT